MSSPITVAPLVPRGANKAKKKRPGFRPIGKSTKVNNNQNNKNDSKPKPQTTVQNDSLLLQESPLKAQDHEQIEKSTDEETQEGQGTDRESPQEKSDTTAEPTPKVKSKATIKKRKQSTSISVGFRKKSLVTDSNLESTIGNKRQRPDTATEEQLSSPTSRPKARNKEVEDSHARDSNRNSTGLVVANVPGRTVASQDREILDRLIAEDPQGTRLNTFCSAFKGKKEPRQQRGTQAGNATTTRVRQNRNDGNANANANNARNFHNDALGRNAPDPSGNPVVKIVDGEIVLQESSMMVPGQRRTVEEVEEEFQDVVEEDAHLAIVGASYNSFVNRRGPQHWTLEETKRFFEALRQLGTDFCSMEHFFENRTRKQLKRKYQTELIRNPSLIEMALDPKKKAKVGAYHEVGHILEVEIIFFVFANLSTFILVNRRYVYIRCGS